MRFQSVIILALVGCVHSTGPKTPGLEGTLLVEPVASTTNVARGTPRAQILPFRISARGSDLAVQRVKVDLGTSADFLKVFSRAYIARDGAILASAELNFSTTFKGDDGHYYITLTGFSDVVVAAAPKIYVIEMDVRPSVDESISGAVVRLPINGVRVVDGSGIDLYGPSSVIEKPVVLK